MCEFFYFRSLSTSSESHHVQFSYVNKCERIFLHFNKVFFRLNDDTFWLFALKEEVEKNISAFAALEYEEE